MGPAISVTSKHYPYPETELGVVGTARRYWIYNKESLESFEETLEGAVFQRCSKVEINLDLLRRWRAENEPATEVPNTKSAEYLLGVLRRFTEAFPESSIEGITFYCDGNEELANLLTQGLCTH